MAAQTGKKNTHLEHLEDDIINLGHAGAQQSIAFVEALLQLFEGTAPNKLSISVKWDGAPAIVCGKDPETGFFFVATKHGAFAKMPKLAFSEEMIDFYYPNVGLQDTLKVAFRELKDLGITDVLQGDIMFTSSSKKIQNIDGAQYVTFKPNTLMYAVPKSDPLGVKLLQSNLGIVFHTKYTGTGAVNTLSATFGVNVGKLKSKTAWIEDASYKDVSGKMTLTAQETRTVSTKLASAKTHALTAKKFLNDVSAMEGDLSVGFLFKIFVNTLVRAGTPITQRSLAGLDDFIIARINKKEEGVKTVTAKQKYSGIRKDTQAYLKANAVNLKSVFALYENLLVMKNILVNRLNEAQSIDTFIETPEGFKHTDPEGYVAVDKKGNAVKLVNRMEFSSANFNAVKDWTKPAAESKESTEKLKTLVFAFGRFNPPTIGHKKLIDKVLSVAKAEKADHVVVLSHTQDGKKNPLDVDTKLYYAEWLFPNVNFDTASPQNPTLFSVLKNNNGKYDKVIMIAGSDRVQEYVRLLAKYNGGTDYNYKVLDVITAGERDPDADGAGGMSSSKMREYALKNDRVNFKKGLPSTATKVVVDNLMQQVREGLGVE